VHKKARPGSPRLDLTALRGKIVRVAGDSVGYRVESNPDLRRIDHLTITVRAANFATVQIALNTYSLRNLDAGFDPRIRVAIIPSTWAALPLAGISRSAGLDYASFEAANRVVYRAVERNSLEEMLIAQAKAALFVEGWGELYLKPRVGIHQVHSCRASSAVPTDYRERDGAVRFYFKEAFRAELLFFKFSGQI
jgi:hypothetical protein